MINPIVFGKWITLTTNSGHKITMSEGEWRGKFTNEFDVPWSKMALTIKREFERHVCGRSSGSRDAFFNWLTNIKPA